MRKSTIAKHTSHGQGSALANGIGRELRRRRIDAGLSQASLGDPLTRAYVCSLEAGRTLPSIPALALILDRLDVSFDRFFLGVQREMTVPYNRGHGDCTADSSPRRRR
jgi:transcriptional regulator with XRE-family HTH domain